MSDPSSAIVERATAEPVGIALQKPAFQRRLLRRISTRLALAWLVLALLLAILLMVSTTVVLANLATDIVHRLIDPRIERE